MPGAPRRRARLRAARTRDAVARNAIDDAVRLDEELAAPTARHLPVVERDGRALALEQRAGMAAHERVELARRAPRAARDRARRRSPTRPRRGATRRARRRGRRSGSGRTLSSQSFGRPLTIAIVTPGSAASVVDELDRVGVGPRLLRRARERHERPVEIAQDPERRVARDGQPVLVRAARETSFIRHDRYHGRWPARRDSGRACGTEPRIVYNRTCVEA